MMDSIQGLDRITAAGILARAALAVSDAANPAAAPVVPNERTIRARLIAEMRKLHGIPHDDSSAGSRDRLSDALDEQSDALLGPTDDKGALERLALKGDLPSDLYKIVISPAIAEVYGTKFAREQRLIEETVRSPDVEQHYGPKPQLDQPYLISLFAKTFHDKFPSRSFVMLVAGAREDLTLNVLQAWRIYPEDVNLVGAASPLEMLERFASVYGHDFTVGNQHGRFVLIADVPDQVAVSGRLTPLAGHGKRQVNLTFFAQGKQATGSRVALIIGTDLDRYRDALAKRGW